MGARVHCNHRRSQHETMKAEPSPPVLIATLSRLAEELSGIGRRDPRGPFALPPVR